MGRCRLVAIAILVMAVAGPASAEVMEASETGFLVKNEALISAVPLKELRLTGALGPLQEAGLAGSMSWKLSEAGSTTKVELTYSVGGYRQEGLRSLAPPVDSVLRGQLLRLKSYTETGRP